MSHPLVEIPVFGALGDDFVDNPVSLLKPCLPARSLPSPLPSRLSLLLFSFATSLILPHNSMRPILTLITSTHSLSVCLSVLPLASSSLLPDMSRHIPRGGRIFATLVYAERVSSSWSTSFLWDRKGCFGRNVLLTKMKGFMKLILLLSLRAIVIRRHLKKKKKISTQPSQQWFLYPKRRHESEISQKTKRA